MLNDWIQSLAICAVCDAPCPGRALCQACDLSLPRIPFACPRCALPRSSAQASCGSCLLSSPEWDDAACAFAYRFPVNELLRAAKFRRALVPLDALAHATAGAVAPAVLGGGVPRADILVPVPLHWRRHWQRGFNQALELARPLAGTLGIPLTDTVLVRRRATRAQSARDADARRRNLNSAFVARRGVRGRRIILFDDVLTTGATLNAATLALRDAGAAHIRVVTCARAFATPDGRTNKRAGRPADNRP